MRTVAIGIMVIAGIVSNSQADEAHALIGSWRLVFFEDKPPSGPSAFPYGKEPKGLLVYDATGHMAVQIMKQPRQKVTGSDADRITAKEKEALFDTYVAYFGTYRVDAAKGVVIHRPEGDLRDVYIGRDEERPFELAGDRLILRPKFLKSGEKWTGVRIFERIK